VPIGWLHHEFCTDRSLASGVDQSHDGAPKVGSTGRSAGHSGVLLVSQIRGAEEGVASRQGMESSGLGNPTVKVVSKKVVSKPHSSY